MAIARDNYTYATPPSTSGSTRYFSHTVSGSDRVLFVGIIHGYDVVFSSVTYNGVAMTQIDRVVHTGGGDWFGVTTYFLVNPSTGTNDVVATLSSGLYAPICVAVSYTGVKQTGQPAQHNTILSTSSPISCSVTTTTDNNWLIGFAGSTGTPTPTLGAGTNTTLLGSASYANAFDTNAAQTPAGLKSMEVTSSKRTAFLIMSIEPVGATPPSPSQQGLLNML